jgi:hypothetical protein
MQAATGSPYGNKTILKTERGSTRITLSREPAFTAVTYGAVICGGGGGGDKHHRLQ